MTCPIRPHRSAVVVVALLVALGCAGCAGSSAGTTKDGLRKLRVVLDWTPNTNHSGMYLAKAKGWYRQAGLDVTFIQPGDSDPLQLVAAGKGDVAVSVSEALLPARAEGLPVQSIAAIIQHNTSGIVSLASDHITRPRDLAGKTYGGYGGQLETALVKKLIACDGGDPSKLKTVDVGEADYRVGLERNQYDDVWIFDGWDKIQLADIDRVKTNEIAFADHTDCIPDWYTPILATSSEVESQRPADLRAFLAATARGYQLAMSDPAAAVDALVGSDHSLSRDLVTRSAAYLSTRYTDHPAAWGVQQAKVWTAFAGFLADQHILKGKVDVAQAWTNAFLPKSS